MSTLTRSRDQSPEQGINGSQMVYSCQGCERLDMQVSLLLKTINSLVESMLGLDSPPVSLRAREQLSLDRDRLLRKSHPVVRDLFIDRGYIPRQPPHHQKEQTVPQDEGSKQDKHSNGLAIKLPTLSSAQLFGDPEIRQKDIYSVNNFSKSSVVINGSSNKAFIVDSEGKTSSKIIHQLESRSF